MITITLKRGDSISLDDLPDKTMTPLLTCLFYYLPQPPTTRKGDGHRRRRATGDHQSIIMSATASEEDEEAVRAAEDLCAWCGIAAVDNIKLEDCDGCDLVKYCSDKCRGEHRHWHAGDCKRRAKVLHDRKLFTQPDSTHLGECPICFLPLPPEGRKSTFFSCCSKTICNGCDYANDMSSVCNVCPFCREPIADGSEESDRRRMKRIEANDPAAIRQMAAICDGEGEYDKAFEYCVKAAKLGDLTAHFNIGVMYGDGEGVEKDEEKEVYHYEKAAIGGHPRARFNVGCVEERNGRVDRAVKHFVIAANLGHNGSMEALWDHFKLGNITKTNLEATLRVHHAAIDAMKSPQRDAAAAAERE